MKHLFIVNPVAGGKKNKYRKVIGQIREVMVPTRKPFEIYVTKAPMDACDKIKKEAEKNDALVVYACGGDGTLNECVNGAAGLRNVAVTHYPTGTGNDFVKMFGDEGARFRDLRELINGELRPLDIIDCNGRYSINICSVGIDARIGTDVHKYSHLPLIGGPTGYIVSLVVNVAKGITRRFRVKTETGRHDGEFSLICVCNGRYYGGGFNPVPEAMPNDGLLDILLVNKVTRRQFFGFVGKYANGKYKERPDLIKHELGKAIIIEGDETMVVNVDGEAIFGRKIYIRVVPDGVNFVFPKNLQFFNDSKLKNEDKDRNCEKIEAI